MRNQDNEPMKTPKTKDIADWKSLPVLARPRPANNAAKERIVIGFVRVRKNVEAYAPATPPPSAEAALFAGFAKRVLMPK